jgi:tetratricopeptide (TPR) repeat protein
MGRYEDAIEVLRDYLELKPGAANALMALGEAYENLGRYPDAIEAYGQAAEDSRWAQYANYKIEQLQKYVEEYLTAPEFALSVSGNHFEWRSRRNGRSISAVFSLIPRRRESFPWFSPARQPGRIRDRSIKLKQGPPMGSDGPSARCCP